MPLTSDPSVMEVVTADPELAQQTMRTSFPGIELAAGDDHGRFQVHHRRVADDVFTVNRLTLTGKAQARGEFPAVVAAGRVRRGRFSVEYGRQSLDTTGPYVRPAGQQRCRFEDAALELITVDPVRFADEAARHLAGTGTVLVPATIETASPVSKEAAALWRSSMDHILAVADEPQVFALPLVRATVLNLYVATMLTAFPLTRSTDRATAPDAHPRALRRALQYMEEHLGDPITTPMIAEAARLSVRGLHHGFVTRLGTTPMRHLRQLRLQSVRADLLAADPTQGDSVADIARRWGFAHLPRFADQYRQAYGELPSRTLRG